MNSRYIDRQELARLLELSVRSITNNETRWGLKILRANANSRIVRWHRAPALQQLRTIGLLQDEHSTKA